MSFTFAHQRTVQGGGVPLPDGNVYDTSAYMNPGVFSATACSGTGTPSAFYNKTVYVRSDNALFYDYSVNGGPFTATTPVPGNPPVTGIFDWNYTLAIPTQLPSAYAGATTIPIVLRLRPVADVTAVQKIINFSLVLNRCDRPVNGSVSFNGSLYSCSNVRPTSTNYVWSTGINENVASASTSTPSGSSTANSGSFGPFTTAHTGQSFTTTINSISGQSQDGFSFSSTITNLGEYWCDPCGGMCYTSGCFNRFMNCDCPSPGSCVPVGTCQSFDCRGSPAGCGGNYVTDCRGLCVDPGSAYQLCDCPSPGSCIPPGPCLTRDCAGTCGGSFVTCDCPFPGSCVASCQTRDCAGVCGGSAVADCFGVCNGTAMDCGCGCGNPCTPCPNGGVACGGNPCPAAPPTCSNDGSVYFECCGCNLGMGSVCDNFGFIASCSGDPSQNCMICVNGTSCAPASSFSTTGGCLSLWDTCANCDGTNPGSAQTLSIMCDNGSASISNSC